MEKSLKHEMLFYGIAKYANVVVTLLTTSVLSRILKPAEFGIVSVVTVFTAFFAILSDMGLGTAVIQNKSLSDEEINDIFSFSIYLAFGFGILFALLGVPIAGFYGNDIYVTVCLLLSVSVLFNAANIIPNAALMKKKQFSSVGKRLILVAVFSGSVAIVLAWMGMSYYAIIAQSIVQAVFIFGWNLWKTQLKFHLHFHFSSIQKVRQYSIFQFLYSIINYFARNLDNLLIGKVLGSVNLAYYDKGYRLMMYPVQNLTYVINPIVHPILSEYQNNKAYVFESYLKLTHILSLLGVLISCVFFWCSEEIIVMFFGEQWGASVPVFRMMSLSVWPQLVSSSAGSIYQSLGNTKLMFKSGMIHFSVTIVLIILGVAMADIMVVALLVTISQFFRFFIDYYFLIAHCFQYPYSKFLKAFQWDLLAMMVLMAVILKNDYPNCNGVFLSFLVKGIILTVVYLIILSVTGQLSALLQFVKKRRD